MEYPLYRSHSVMASLIFDICPWLPVTIYVVTKAHDVSLAPAVLLLGVDVQ